MGARKAPAIGGPGWSLGPSASIIDDARSGRPASQRELYLRGLGLVRRFARGLGLPGSELPEAAHDAATQAVLDLPGYRSESRFATWLYAIARHQQIRRRSQRRAAEAVLPSGDSIDAPQGETPDLGLLVRENLCAGVRAVLAASERRGFAFLAVRVLGARAEAVAGLLGCSANTVHQLAHKGAAQARLAIEVEGGGRVAACGSCRGPLAEGGGGVAPTECPVRWFMSMTDNASGLRAEWEAYRRLRGGDEFLTEWGKRTPRRVPIVAAGLVHHGC